MRGLGPALALGNEYRAVARQFNWRLRPRTESLYHRDRVAHRVEMYNSMALFPRLRGPPPRSRRCYIIPGEYAPATGTRKLYIVVPTVDVTFGIYYSNVSASK